MDLITKDKDLKNQLLMDDNNTTNVSDASEFNSDLNLLRKQIELAQKDLNDYRLKYSK